MATRRVEHLLKPAAVALDDPQLWTNRQCIAYARNKGLIYKDRVAIESYAKRLGLETKPLAVAPALIKAIAAYEQAHGEI